MSRLLLFILVLLAVACFAEGFGFRRRSVNVKNKASHGRAKRSLDAAQKGSPLHGNALFHAAKAAHHTREKRSLTDLAQRFRLGNTNAEKQTVNKAMEKIKALKERASNRPEFNNLFNRNRNKLFTPFK